MSALVRRFQPPIILSRERTTYSDSNVHVRRNSETYTVIPSVYLDIGMVLGIPPTTATDMARAPPKFYDTLPDVRFNEDDIMALAAAPSPATTMRTSTLPTPMSISPTVED